MCCASAAPRTAWRWEKRCCSSIARWPRISITGASRQGNWRRRCAFSRRRGWECWRAARGCATPSMPTAARGSLRRRLPGFPASSMAQPVEANAVFLEAPEEILNRAPRARMELLHLHRRRGALHVRVGQRSQAHGCAEPRSARMRGCAAARLKRAATISLPIGKRPKTLTVADVPTGLSFRRGGWFRAHWSRCAGIPFIYQQDYSLDEGCGGGVQ